MFADVIIPLALPKNYTWAVPEQMRAQVRPGVRVEVGLGKNKKYAGLIKRLHTEKPAYETKDILNILDLEPIIFDTQLKLWEWIAAYYMCSEGEVMAAALPAHFKLSSETVLIVNEEYGTDFTGLNNEEFIIAEALQVKKEISITEAQELLDSSHIYPIVKGLIEKKCCFVWEALKETYSAKKEVYVSLHKDFEDEDKLSDLLNNWSRAPKQMELLLAYLHLQKTASEVTKADLLKKSGASDAQLKGLIEKNILIAEKKNVDRLSYRPKKVTIDFQLTNAQEEALDRVRSELTRHAVCLLHGVTSSGKTQVYIKLIEDCINAGKQVLYLLPEIALTSQIIRRLEKHFGGYIGIYHSKFSQNERIEIWNKIKKGDLRIVLGARSALFLPFENLGLMIVDEEHDSSYKQYEPAPRYNARDAAIYYGSLLKASIVLGSATPSVDTYFNATNDKYGLAELNERYGGMDLPAIDVIDLKNTPGKSQDKIIITEILKSRIQDALEKKQTSNSLSKQTRVLTLPDMPGVRMDSALPQL